MLSDAGDHRALLQTALAIHHSDPSVGFRRDHCQGLAINAAIERNDCAAPVRRGRANSARKCECVCHDRLSRLVSDNDFWRSRDAILGPRPHVHETAEGCTQLTAIRQRPVNLTHSSLETPTQLGIVTAITQESRRNRLNIILSLLSLIHIKLRIASIPPCPLRLPCNGHPKTESAMPQNRRKRVSKCTHRSNDSPAVTRMDRNSRSRATRHKRQHGAYYDCRRRAINVGCCAIESMRMPGSAVFPNQGLLNFNHVCRSL